MPVIIPSHQAPALLLKRWRPRQFSGLGLCLGSLAPDLEYILRLDNEWLVSHQLAAQLYFTVPVVVLLHALLLLIVLPYWLPRIPPGPPFHFDELLALRLPSDGLGWVRVAASGWMGGVTHVLLDGITHGNHSGWLVPYFPFLSAPLSIAGPWPLHDALQVGLSLWLGWIAWATWADVARRRLLWRWRGEVPRARLFPSRRFPAALAWLGLLALVGFLRGSTLRPGSAPFAALELGVFGALAFASYGLVAVPLLEHGLRRLRVLLHRRIVGGVQE